MSTSRWAAAAAAIATAVAACSGGEADGTRPSANATAAPRESAGDAAPTPAPAASPSTVVGVGELVETYPYELRGGEATVGDARLEVPLGDTIDLLVTSDIDDVVLVPAFEIEQRVLADEPTLVSVTVTRPGVFAVESATGILLTELVVE